MERARGRAKSPARCRRVDRAGPVPAPTRSTPLGPGSSSRSIPEQRGEPGVGEDDPAVRGPRPRSPRPRTRRQARMVASRFRRSAIACRSLRDVARSTDSISATLRLARPSTTWSTRWCQRSSRRAGPITRCSIGAHGHWESPSEATCVRQRGPGRPPPRAAGTSVRGGLREALPKCREYGVAHEGEGPVGQPARRRAADPR